MSETAPTGSVAIQISKTLEGKFKFQSGVPTGSGITFDDASRKATINELGTFQLSYSIDGFDIKDPGITWGKSPTATTTPPTGYTVNEDPSGSSFTVEVTTAQTGGAQTASFLIHQDSTTDVIDPTILVDPPHGQDDQLSDGIGDGTLLVSVDLDEPQGRYVYKEQVVDAPVLRWNQEASLASVLDYGIYYVVFGADFELNEPAILFEGDPPSYVTLKQTGHLAILEIEVKKEETWPQTIPLRLNPKGAIHEVRNEPTILVDPPHGDD